MTNLQAELLELTKALVKIPSTKSNPKALMDCADFIADYFAGTGLRVRELIRHGVPSVVVTKGHTTKPKVFLAGHFDVVEAAPEQFTPKVEGDKLVGRGVFDMKSGVAANMHLMKSLAHTDHDVGLMLTGDEESGGMHGTAHVVEEGFGADIILLPDGGFAPHCISAQQKGFLFLELTAKGTAAHGSRPWEGKNAIEQLHEAVGNIRALFPPLPDKDGNKWINTVNISRIEGGQAPNAVPDFALATLDIRLTEDQSLDDMFARIKSVVPPDMQIAIKISGEPFALELDHPDVTAYTKAIQGEGLTPTTRKDYGASDARYFANGTHVIMTQPEGKDHHGPHEWVSIPSIETYYKITHRYLDNLVKKG